MLRLRQGLGLVSAALYSDFDSDYGSGCARILGMPAFFTGAPAGFTSRLPFRSTHQ